MTKALGHERNPTIDAFRGIAILSVMSYHYTSETGWTGLTAVPALFPVGRFGVHVFFVISGLVISMTARASSGPVEFAFKRLARLYPAYLFWMIVTWLAMSLTGSVVFRHQFIDLLKNIIPLGGHHPYVDPSYWSLIPELQFYIFTALSLFVFRKEYWIGLVAITVLGGFVALSGKTDLADRFLVAEYMPLFLLGVAAWLLIYEHKNAGWICGAVAIALLPFGASRWDIHFHPHWQMAAYVGGVVISLLALLAKHVKLTLGPLSWIGLRSYSMYLLHQALGVTALHGLHEAGVPAWLCLGLVVALVLVLGQLSFRLVEEPSSKALRRAWKRLERVAGNLKR